MDTPESGTELGHCRLDIRLGAGSAGEVWRAHRPDGSAVAVKILSPVDTAHRHLTRRFRDEIRRQAALDHPGIVDILGIGEVRPDDADRPKTPYFLMELAEGTLSDAPPIDTWPRLLAFLRQILRTLAYAHARGVIHRDLKPGNILYFPDRLPGHRLKLGDFGLAFPEDPGEMRTTVHTGPGLVSTAGTPRYMAPEQCVGDWRSFGPWTDLYQLGVITWMLVSDRPPFPGGSADELTDAHLHYPRPPLAPQFPVPRRLGDWVERMMARHPDARFRRAADALRTLRDLQERGEAPESTFYCVANAEAESAPESPTRQVTETDQPPNDSAVPLDALDLPGAPGATPPDPDRALPADWQSERSPDRRRGRTESFDIFPLRRAPMTGRRDVRDALWTQLRRTARRGESHAALLTGPAGIGKSRMAEWVAARADELGAVASLQASHEPGARLGDGLVGMLENFFRSWNLDRHATLELVENRLARLGFPADGDAHNAARALTEWLRPSDPSRRALWSFESERERFDLLARLLGRLSSDRPVLLVLEDLQWGDQTRRWLNHLLDDSGLAVFVVATLRTDLDGRRTPVGPPEPTQWRRDLESRPNLQTLALSALEPDEHAELVDTLVRLPEHVVRAVHDRAEGLPLFTLQLLDHWVEQGWLAADGAPYRLTLDLEDALPPTFQTLWRERVDQVLGRLPAELRADARATVELAATLGQHVNAEEWTAVQSHTDFDAPTALLDGLLDAGLAERTPTGWQFTHGLLAESLRIQAELAGRLADHHAACAAGLRDAADPRLAGTAERLAHHHRHAGQLAAATRALDAAIDRFRRRGQVDRMERLLEAREDLIELLDPPADRRPRLKQDYDRAWLRWHTGQPEAAEAEFRQLTARIHRDDDARLLGRTLRARMSLATELGRPLAALQLADRANTILRDVEAPAERARCEYTIGYHRMARGDYAGARRRFEKARRLASEASDAPYVIVVAHMIAWLDIQTGELEAAERRLTQHLEVARRHGMLNPMVMCLSSLGEVAAARDDRQAARDYFGRALRIRREHGMQSGMLTNLVNLATAELFDDAPEAAAEHFDDADCHLPTGAHTAVSLNLRLGQLAADAALGRHDALGAHLEAAERELDAVDARFPVFERLVEFAARHLEQIPVEARTTDALATLENLAERMSD